MIVGDHFGNELNTTMEVLSQWIPKSSCVHILPPFNSAGDYGFAPNSILEIDRKLGSWEDIKAFSSCYKIILDGIFNHIGIHSSIFPDPVMCAKEQNKKREYFYIFTKSDVDHVDNLSTRGGSVFRRTFMLDGVELTVWQTFSDTSIDLNLEHIEVQKYIDEFVDLCVKNHIWGIRLDAVAYYCKELGKPQLHHPKAQAIARKIANKFIHRGFFVLAQLDSDPRGCAYFPPDMGYAIPVCDYAYTAYLVYSQLSGNVERLAQYLLETDGFADLLLRTPRNHDGVLLRPRLFDNETKSKLLELCDKYELPVRVTNESPYEINNSFPYICAKCSDSLSEGVARNHASIFLTVLQKGISYIYFPELVGYMPELTGATCDDKDPRGLNRMPIEQDYLNRAIVEPHNKQLIDALAFLEQRLSNSNKKSQQISVVDTGCLVFSRNDVHISLVINFSHDCEYSVNTVIGEACNCLFSSSSQKKILKPGDYAIVEIENVSCSGT